MTLLGLSGCTGSNGNGSDGQQDTGDGGTSASPTPAPTLPSGVTAAPVPTQVPNKPADRQNVVMSGCSKADKGWQATGTATNTGKKKVTYEITVFFTTNSATTLNSAAVKVGVDAGETEKWTADKQFSTPPEVLCVLRGVAKI